MVNVVVDDIAEAMNATAAEFPADVDEFEASIDLTGTGDLSLTLLQVGQVLSTTDPVPVTISYTSAGTAPTAGAATVIFTYVQP